LPEGAKVRLDFMLLKAAVDAASPERIEAAQQVAVDPAAPRRALVQAREDEVSPPMDYLGEIADMPPRQLWRDPQAVRAWQQERARRTPVTDLDGRAALLARVPEADPGDGIFLIPPERRFAGYDAMSAQQRASWQAAFRSVASEWLGVAQAEFAAADDEPTASEFGYQSVTYRTADGGLLLICAAPESAPYHGVAAWFEAALFVLGEVAEAAGFTQPSHFDVV
jgi:hypothetical protein